MNIGSSCPRFTYFCFRIPHTFFNFPDCIETCRCPKELSTAWTYLSPLIEREHVNHIPNGILPPFINSAVKVCCQSCIRGHGGTTVDWMNDGEKDVSHKTEQQGILEALVTNTLIGIPFAHTTQDFLDTNTMPFAFIPITVSPGVAVFRKVPSIVFMSNEGASGVVNSVTKIIPLFIMSSAATIFAGTIFWITVNEHFVLFQYQYLYLLSDLQYLLEHSVKENNPSFISCLKERMLY